MALLYQSSRKPYGSAMLEKPSEIFDKQLFWVLAGVFAILTLMWCYKLGIGNPYGASLAIATCSAAFSIGSLIGFVFTIFGDEVEPLGKIRDAMIALASGVAGVSLAKIAQIKSTIGSIPLITGTPERSSWFAVLFVTMYFVAGFYFMYLMRKLVLNPALAKSGKELVRIQGRAGSIATELSAKIPPSFLLRRDYIGEVVETGGAEVEKLRSELYADSINEFLKVCETDIQEGIAVSQDNINKAATLHYYRTYFEKDNDAREQQQEKAIVWINRALLCDPLDPSLQIKLADLLAGLDRYDEAVAIFERLERDDDSPQFVQQWLGYFLLFMEDRELDAIKHSTEYHNRFPSESAGLFNAACGYAQIYTIECRAKGLDALPESENRRQGLEALKRAILIDQENKTTAMGHSEPGDSFDFLARDEEFKRLTS
jgi:tetratricopeptide (TPR) repeat protein